MYCDLVGLLLLVLKIGEWKIACEIDLWVVVENGEVENGKVHKFGTGLIPWLRTPQYHHFSNSVRKF